MPGYRPAAARLAARGGGASGHAATVKALELMANHEIGQGNQASEVLD